MITNWYDELVTPGARPPAFYVSMTPEFATGEYGFPAPSNGATFTAYDGSEWVYEPDAFKLGDRWVMTHYPPTGDPYMDVKRNERRK